MNGSLAITWAPSPKYLIGAIKPIFQHNRCMEILQLLKYCSKDYEIYPELTLNGNIHYHMILSINDTIKWYKKILPSLKHNGYVCIKRVDDEIKWRKYITKDLTNMSEILGLTIPIIQSPRSGKRAAECNEQSKRQSGEAKSEGLSLDPNNSSISLNI